MLEKQPQYLKKKRLQTNAACLEWLFFALPLTPMRNKVQKRPFIFRSLVGLLHCDGIRKRGVNELVEAAGILVLEVFNTGASNKQMRLVF